MFFDSVNHILSNMPAPVLFIDRNRQTSEMLMAEAQTIIGNANTKLMPLATRFAFEFKHHVNTEWYSDSFAKELKKIITAYYTFYRYVVRWDNDIVIVSWAPVPLVMKSENCSSDDEDDCASEPQTLCSSCS
jgi:hypothetical protein